MAEHGEYRSLYTALANDDEFIQTSSLAKAVFYTLKLTLPSIGIGVLSIVPLAATVNDTRHAVETAIAELGPKWVRRERSVFWIVNGLRFHPNLSPANPKHRRHVITSLNNLPRAALVEEFRAMYTIWLSVPTEKPGKGIESDPEEYGITTNEEEDKDNNKLQLPTSSSAGAMTPEKMGVFKRALITAANRGMKANPNIGDQFNPIPHGHGKSGIAAEAISAGGVPQAFAEAVIAEMATAYEPSTRSRQISSLAFCTDHVIERWEQYQAMSSMAPGVASVKRNSRRAGNTPTKFAYEATQGEVKWAK